MKTKFIIIAILFLIVSGLFGQDDTAESTLLNVGDKLPSFYVPSLTGESISSNDLEGNVVLINFWATWCPPCRAEFPLLQKDIYDAIKDKNFRVMAISRGEETDTVKNFIDKYKYTFPVYLDKDAKVYNLFANKYIPRNFVIGKDGNIKWASTGFKKEEFNEMVKLIKKELKK